MNWISWKIGRNFGRWHASRDTKITLCGQTAAGILSIRTSDPSPDQQCVVCRRRVYSIPEKEVANGVP